MMTLKRFELGLVCLGLAVVLGGCGGNMAVLVNDRAVYDPLGRLPAGEVEDANLQGCINFAMEQQGVESVAELSALSCPGSEIRSLAFVSVLGGARFLDLAGNNISNLTPLEDLPLLNGLNLSDNAIVDVSPLLLLDNLVSLNLRGNGGIPCQQIALLRERLGENLLAPEDCEQSGGRLFTAQ